MPGIPKAYAGGFCQDVECLDVGVHRGDEYTLADLQDMARNFHLGVGLHDPPVVVGHEEDQPLVEGLAEHNSGAPAVGWITALRVARRRGADGATRPVLLADLDHVHPTVAALVNARAYRKVSPEIYDEDGYPEDAPAGWRGKALRRLALLGGELPHIRTLRDLPPVRFAEASVPLYAERLPTGEPHRLVTLTPAGRRRTPDGKAWAVFSEVTPMDRSALEKQLAGLGWSEAAIEAVKPLDDEAFAALVNAILAQSAAAGAGAPPPAAAAAGGLEEMAEFPPGMDRQAVTDALVAQGQDPAALAALSDDDLIALWNQMQTQTPPAPAPAPAALPMSERGAVARYAELNRKVAAAQRQVARLDLETRRRRAAERFATVKAYCERWLKDGYVTPAEVDSRSGGPNLYKRLMYADDVRVRRFGERSLSDFDAAVAEVEARGPGWARRNTAERVPDPETKEGRNGTGAVSAERRRQLLSHTERGKAILRAEDAQARRQGK